MRRRGYLALLAAGSASLAGCADSDGGNESGREPINHTGSDSNQTDGNDTRTEPPADNTTDPGGENGTDNGTNEQPGDGNTTEPDGGNESESGEPTDAERAQQLIDDARAELDEATAALPSQVTARTTIEAVPIRDHLSEARIAMDDAEDLDEDVDVQTLRTREQAIRTLLDNIDTYNEVAGRVDAALEDLEPNYDVLQGASADPLSDIPDVELTIAADLDTAVAISDAVAPLRDAEDAFWPPLRELADGTITDSAESDFGTARSSYASAVDASTGASESPAFGDGLDQIICYGRPMETAADSFRRVLVWAGGTSDTNLPGDLEDGMDALDAAAGCSLRDFSEEPVGSIESGVWSAVGPIFDVAMDTWTEDGTYYIGGTLTNLTPYSVVTDVRYDYDHPEHDDAEGMTVAENVEIAAGGSWSPAEPVERDPDYVSNAVFVAESMSWGGNGP